MSEEMKKIEPVAFRGLELGKVTGGDTDMSLVLKTVTEEPLREYVVPVPVSCDGEYTMVIRQLLSGQIRSADSFFRDILLAVGTTLSSLVIRHADGKEGDRAEMKLVTREMEVIPFTVPMHEGVLYAMVSGLPILVEEELLVPSIRRDEEEWEGVMRRRTPEAEFAVLCYDLEQGRLPEDYESDRLMASLDVIGEERVSDLQRRAIETERYEWAQWIKDYLERE